MMVSELEKGMLIKPIGQGRFAIPSFGFLTVRTTYPRISNSIKNTFCDSNTAIYLGTRKDVNVHDMKWVNRFVLIDNKVVGVHPPDWAKIQPVRHDENR